MRPIKNLGKLKRQVHKTKTEASIRVCAENKSFFQKYLLGAWIDAQELIKNMSTQLS